MKYEFFKLFTQRYYRFIFLIIFSLNIMLCCFDCISSAEYKNQQLLRTYVIEVAPVYSNYAGITDYFNNNTIPPEVEDIVYGDINQYADYKNKISELLSETDVLLRNNNTSTPYLEDVYRRYSALYENVVIGFEQYRGWDVLLDCKWPAILTLVFHVLIAGMFFGNEKSIYSIIHTTPNGHIRLGVKKIFALLLHIIFSLGIYTGVEVLVVVSNIGFSNPFNAIQAFDGYLYCPYEISIIEAFIMLFVIRIIVISVLCVFLLLLSNILVNPVIVASVGMLVLLIQFFLLLVSSNNTESIVYLTNVLVSCAATIYFKRYHAIVLNNTSFPILNVYLVILILITILSGLISLYLFTNDIEAKHTFPVKVLNKPRKRYKLDKHLKFPKYYIQSLLYYEATKVLCSKSVIMFIILIVLFQSVYSIVYYSSAHNGEDKVWQTYLETLEGEYTDEKHQYVLNEYDYITEVILNYNKYCDEYKTGNITYEEFDGYINEYTYADSRKDVILRLKKYSEYLQELSTGQKAYYVYDTGWISCLTNHSDIISIIFVIYISCFLYNYEITQDNQTSAMATLISTCKYGRKHIIRIKLFITLIAAVMILSMQYIINIVFCIYYWYLPMGNVSVNSIMCFSTLPPISITASFIMYYAMKLFIVIFFGILSFILMAHLKKVLLVYVVDIVLICLPVICSALGITAFNYISPMIIYLHPTYVTEHTFIDMSRYLISCGGLYLLIALLILIFSYKRSEKTVL